MSVTIKLRKGTSFEWDSNSSVVLASGEPGFEVDTGRLKIGNGTLAWNTLPYASIIPSGLIAGSGISIDFGTNGSTATIHASGIGGNANEAKSLVTTVFNKTGSPISKGKAVYINGGQGDLPTIQLAIASGDATSAGTYGVTNQSIANMASGNIVVIGALSGINTDPAHGGIAGATEGSVLYLSPTVSGELTTTKPSAPDHIVTIGNVVRVHQNVGVIEVKIVNGFELEELHNVAISGVKNNQYLYYDSSTDLWKATSSGIFTKIYADGNIGTSGIGQIYLNAPSGNRIDFNASGIAAPSFTNNRSVGTKIILSPNVASNQVEYAIGIEAGAMWHSIPISTSRAFKWYAGTANIATLLGNGTLDINGSTSQINVDDLRLDTNTLSITTANTDLIISPNGNGALLADTSGNVRGTYAVDLQRDRTSVSGVAAGGYSVICGGSDNRTANNYSTIGGGQTNTASNLYSTICGGDLNTANGNRSVICGGGSNTSSAQSTVVGGGSNNQATASYAIVPGGYRAKATRQGEFSHAAGYFNAIGDAQHTVLIARRLTTNASGDVLTLNSLAPSGTSNIITIPAQTAWAFDIKLSAYNLTNNEAGWWIFKGGIKRNNANVTSLVGTVSSESGVDTTLSTSAATIVADDVNEALEIRVTGVAAKNIRWVAVADISQVSYGTP